MVRSSLHTCHREPTLFHRDDLFVAMQETASAVKLLRSYTRLVRRSSYCWPIQKIWKYYQRRNFHAHLWIWLSGLRRQLRITGDELYQNRWRYLPWMREWKYSKENLDFCCQRQLRQLVIFQHERGLLRPRWHLRDLTSSAVCWKKSSKKTGVAKTRSQFRFGVSTWPLPQLHPFSGWLPGWLNHGPS